MKISWQRATQRVQAALSWIVLFWCVYVAVKAQWNHEDVGKWGPQVVSIIGLLAVVILIDQWNRSELITQIGRLLPNASATRLLNTWGEADKFISSARSKIDFVDSLHSDSSHFSTLIGEAGKANSLKVNIHMLDPDFDYGAARLQEMRIGDKDKTIPDLKTEYLAEFGTCLNQIKTHLSEIPKVSLQVFKYKTMPGMRMIIIDDSHFIVGWFPLYARNPAYSCIYVPANSLAEQDVEAVKRFRKQLEWVQTMGTKVYPK